MTIASIGAERQAYLYRVRQQASANSSNDESRAPSSTQAQMGALAVSAAGTASDAHQRLAVLVRELLIRLWGEAGYSRESDSWPRRFRT